ncbi:hypothetical protein Tco_1430955 [Tanacetum coccineum]
MKAICNLDVHVDSKAPKPSSQTEEASKSQTGQSKKETKSSSAKDKSPSHPSPLTPVVGEMYKEAQQATGGLTSLGTTSEEGAHPQLSSVSNPNFLVDKTKSAGDGLKSAHTNSSPNEESRAGDILLKVKLEDLSDILKDTRSAFFTLDSPPNEPIIVSNESEEEEEEEVARDKDTEATSHDVPKDTSVPPPPSLKLAQIQELMAQVHLLQSQKEELEQAKAKAEADVASMKAKPSYLDINQLTELLVTSLKHELSKLLASHDFASCLPTELKDLPSKITRLSREIKKLKKHVRDMEIKLPGQVYLVQEKLKILDSLSSLLHKVTDTLNRFATMVKNASGAISLNIPSAGKATASPAEGEKNTKDADINLKDKLVDLLGKNVVTQYYTKKLLFDKYCDKMLKRKKSPKITKCEDLTNKGPITLKI